MKYFLLFLGLTFTTSCSKKPNNCSSFKTGTFRYLNLTLKDFIVERNDTIQIETNEQNNSKIICKIKWLSDCEYTLTPIELVNYPKDTKIVPMSIEIIKASKKQYTFVSTIDTLSYKLEMKKIK